jgi:alkanesulfonate monooxygenase SsuD/methylene tetrahydromethanopterin reductase-like flavin-dependent oxidoreductase (luciferase family)
VITGLWETPVGESYSFAGEHYSLVDSPALPKPTQARVPVIVGGGGAKRTPALAVRFATEFNLPFPDFADIPGKFAGVRAACEAVGRNPGELVYSAALIAVAGADEAEFTRRAAAVGREPAELREHGVAGTTAEVVDRLGVLAADGVECVYLQIMDLADLDHLDFLAREVMPQLD